MLDVSVSYIGSDENFSQALDKSARYLGVSYHKYPSHQNPHTIACEPLLLIIDMDTELARSGVGLSRGLYDSCLVVLALPESGDIDVKILRDIWNDSIDFMNKSIKQELLDKRISFYIRHLTAVSNPASEVNQNLTHRISDLQENLTKINLELRVQNEVLDKIGQIRRLSRKINCLDLDKIATVCIEEIPLLISSRFASLYRFDSEKGVLHLLRHNHPYPIDRLVILTEHGNSPMAVAIGQKKLLLIKDFSRWETEADTTFQRMYARNYQSNSCIIVPLKSDERVLGVLNLADKINASFFDDTTDWAPIELLSEIIGSAMSNIELYGEMCQQARTDGMTGLVNYRTFYDELDKEIQRSKRYGGNLSLIMVDVDELKEVNDTYGHRCGDLALMHVANQIVYCTRDIDIAARYGGDEFTIILPNTSLTEAKVVAERLGEMVAGNPVNINGDEFYISVSIGIKQFDRNKSIEEFVNESDNALFKAKSAGKNRIHAF